VTAEGCAKAPSGLDVTGHSRRSPSLSVSPSFSLFVRLVGVGISARMYTAKRGRRGVPLRTAPVYDVIFVSFYRANMRPACLFNIATVSSRLSRSLYPLTAAILFLCLSLTASLIHRARRASMFNMSLFYLPSKCHCPICARVRNGTILSFIS